MVGLSPDGELRSMQDGDTFMGVAGIYTRDVVVLRTFRGEFEMRLA